MTRKKQLSAAQASEQVRKQSLLDQIVRKAGWRATPQPQSAARTW